jgi:hypothetical protein
VPPPDRHTDSVSHAKPATTTTTTPAAQQAAKAVDNTAQTAKAIADRERTFTVGGDEPEASPIAPAAPSPIEVALARAKQSDRPSPFGITQFPPLPLPPRFKP